MYQFFMLTRYKIVRENFISYQEYLTDLYSRYGDAEDAPPAPELPDWCYEVIQGQFYILTLNLLKVVKDSSPNIKGWRGLI